MRGFLIIIISLGTFIFVHGQESLDSIIYPSIEVQINPYNYSNLDQVGINYEFEVLFTHNMGNEHLSFVLGTTKLNSLRIPESISTKQERRYVFFSLLYSQNVKITRLFDERIRLGFEINFPIRLEGHGIIQGWYGSLGPINFVEDVGPGLNFRIENQFKRTIKSSSFNWGFAPFLKLKMLNYLRENSRESTPDDYQYLIGMNLIFEKKFN